MSSYYPPPPGTDGGRSNASRHGHLPAPAGYRPPPPAFSAPPPPPPHQSSSHSRNYDSYTSNSYDNRDRDRGRDDRTRDWDRDDRYARNARDDRYQPSRRHDTYQAPSRNQDSYRDHRSGGDSFRPPQGNFTFRADKPSGVGDSSNSYNNSRFRSSDQNNSRAPPSFPHPASRRIGGRGGRGRGRGGWKPFKPSERALLQTNGGGQTTEDYADEENGPSYKSLDQLSDSDEADMDFSDSDETGEPTAKRARTTTKPDDGDAAPKWSNPDPYTALPPLEDADKKKKDMVQMIRKARVETSGARTSLAAPGADQDFLRFDSDSEKADDSSDDFIDPLTYKRDREDRSEPSAGPQGGSNTLPTTYHPLPNKPSTSEPGQVAFQMPAHHAANGLGKKADVVIDLTQSPTKAFVTKQVAPQADLTHSSDLGSRKRTHDDVLKLPAHAKAQIGGGRKNVVSGIVKSEWRALAGQPSCPWLQIATSEAHINIRLHMEVTDFYEHLKPLPFEARLRAKLVDDLNQVVAKRLQGYNWRDCSFYPFGSYMSGLYLPTGDMDLAFCSQPYVNGGYQRVITKSQVRRFSDFIKSERLAAGSNVEALVHTKVPLVKYVDKTTGLKVDISFENTSGIVAIATFNAWKEQWPVMPALVTVIKQFLLMRGLNEPVNGGIGGFSTICLVVSMLQHMPPIQSGDMEQRHDLGSLLMHFFDLYGNRFNYENVALTLNPPGYVAKSRTRNVYHGSNQAKKISIIDPNNPENDIAGGSSNFERIASCFANAHKLLKERLQRIAAGEKFDSILEVILGGNYSSFREQRDYLYKLHQQLHD